MNRGEQFPRMGDERDYSYGPRNMVENGDYQRWRPREGDYQPSQYGAQSYGGQSYSNQSYGSPYGSQGTPGRGYGAPDPGNQGYGDRPWGMQNSGGQSSSGPNYGMQGRAQQYGIGSAGNQGFPGSNFPDQDMRDQGWSGGSGGQSEGFSYGRQGMQSGRHRGKGPKGYRRSDERIREEISDRLTEHGEIDASELEVQVSNGEATLTGFVDERRQKRMAEDLAEQVAGVRDVHNQLRVHEHEPESDRGQGEQAANGRTMVRSH